MSFTVDLVLTDVPTDDRAAWKYIQELREEYYEDKTGAHEKLIKLHEALTKKYPCLCSFADDDPEMEDSPWADGPMLGNFASKMGMLAIVYSRVDEVFPFILENALALNIIVADGQSEKLYRPGDPDKTGKKPWWKLW
ncbi:MAG TPA: hypothetical protein VIF82_05735 [Burkholderiaceae bacterium]|jgi:hypothetical protein